MTCSLHTLPPTWQNVRSSPAIPAVSPTLPTLGTPDRRYHVQRSYVPHTIAASARVEYPSRERCDRAELQPGGCTAATVVAEGAKMATGEARTFGALLRRYRQAAAFSQEVLAARAGLSAVAISALERGTRRAPHLATVEMLA